MYDEDDQTTLDDETLVLKPQKDESSHFNMQNPNSWYSNPQIWQQSIRWYNNRGESGTVPEWAKVWTVYYDSVKKVERKYTAQQRDWTWVNWRWTWNAYAIGNYVVYNNKLYECIKAHTSSWTILPINTTYWVREWTNIHRWTPEYWTTYCFASVVSPQSIGNTSLTQIIFDNYSTNDWYTASTAWSVVVPEDWVYLLIGLAKFASAGWDRHIYIYKNWVSLIDIRQPWYYYYYVDWGWVAHTVYPPEARDLELTWAAGFKKDDVLDLYVEQNSWWSINVTPYFKIYKLTWL